MGVSFKVAKTGTRFRAKPVQSESIAEDSSENLKDKNSKSRIVNGAESTSAINQKPEVDVIEAGEDAAGISGSSSCSGGQLSSPEHEVSFSLNLFRDGYSIGKPSESGSTLQGSLQDIPKSLHPYDRTSETFFSAIESGRLPGDILDDIPSKYSEGMLVCEVRDYRKCGTEAGSGVSTVDRSPVITKVHLRMSLENVVKDMPLISDDSWTYSDLMEVESRILKVLQPQLCLDPTPMLDRLCGNPVPTKLNLGLSNARKRRLRQIPGVTVTSNNQAHGKKVCIDRVPESSNCRSGDSGNLSIDTTTQHVLENMNAHPVSSSILPSRPKSLPDASAPSLPSLPHQPKYQIGVGYQRAMQDHGSGSNVNASGVSAGGRDLVISCTDTMSSTVSSLHGKRENQDVSLTPLSKRARQTSLGVDANHAIQQQQFASQLDNLTGTDMSWNNQLLQHQTDPRGMSYASVDSQKYPQKVLEGVPNQEAILSSLYLEPQTPRYGVKQERIETEKLDKAEFDRSKNDSHPLETESNQLDSQQPRLQQRLPQHPLMRSNFPPQMQWQNLGQIMDRDSRKEEHLQKRKLVQSPRVSAPLVPSPVSSKSGEFSSGSFGPQFGAVATSTAFGSSQKEKAAPISGVTAVGTPSVASSPSDSIQRQHQVPTAVKRRSNSLPKTPSMSGVGSPASVSNMSVPLSANSPPVGSPSLADQAILERFSKIEMVTMRHQLNCKKNKVDQYPVSKAMGYTTEQLSSHLSNASNNEDLKDPTCRWPMSKSLIGGSMNVSKIRIINFVQGERRLQGNLVSFVSKARSRLIMSEKQHDGTVAMQYGDLDDSDPLAAEDYLPTLPSTHYADLLAAQFCSLMLREGYQFDDQVRPKPAITVASTSQSNAPGVPPNGIAAEMQQYPNSIPGQPSGAVATPVSTGNASLNQTQNHLSGTRVLPSGNSQALQMSQGFMQGVTMPAMAQQLDPLGSLQQQQQQQNQLPQIQQHAQLQRSSMMLPGSPLSHLNALGQNLNVQLSSHIGNKPSPLQLQLLQQQQQQQQQQPQQQQQQQQPQQQQPQMQRKMMSLGTPMGIGNMGNVNLGGLGNIMGIGGVRGMGGAGMSAPMGPMSGMGNMGQNPMNLSQASNISNVINQHLRSGNITNLQAAAAMASKLRMPQSRAGMLGGPQSGIVGMSGAGHMHPGSAGLSMLGQTLNRNNFSPLQRTTMASMGPPKTIPGSNFYMNQQQQQQLQLQQQQLQLHQQQQQHLHQQQPQQIGSPLQAVVSPQQVGSPTMLPQQQLVQQPQQQQQISPQQMIQQNPMSPQLSSGALPPMNAANAGVGPASPQLSSQTHGSVGSITSSPMELQGVNKSNSVGNL